jgi:uncharacterized protein YndB with AHSA1/START domain
MEAIRHYLVIKNAPEKVFEAITTEEGLKSWWAKETVAKAEVGFVNIFTFGKSRNEIRVTNIVLNQKVEWTCVKSIDEWMDTTFSFHLEEKEGKTILRFTHSGWKAITDTFADCNYAWGQFMKSLKMHCETGTGTPA